MSEDIKALLDFMQQYVDEPNVPDYSGEYPPCWEIEQEEVDKILNYIKEIKTENKQIKEQLQQRDSVIEEAIKYLEGSYEMAVYTKSVTLEKENVDDLLDILNKYKKEESEIR